MDLTAKSKITSKDNCPQAHKKKFCVCMCVFKSRAGLGYKEYKNLDNNLFGLFLPPLLQYTSIIFSIYQLQNTDESYRYSAMIVSVPPTNEVINDVFVT